MVRSTTPDKRGLCCRLDLLGDMDSTMDRRCGEGNAALESVSTKHVSSIASIWETIRLQGSPLLIFELVTWTTAPWNNSTS